MFPCPSCGFIIFEEAAESYEICSICGWEDDDLQLKHPTLKGGANSLSLLESQKSILEKIPVQIKEFNGYKRAVKWRPLLPEDLVNDNPNIKNGLDYFNSVADLDEVKYYWEKEE